MAIPDQSNIKSIISKPSLIQGYTPGLNSNQGSQFHFPLLTMKVFNFLSVHTIPASIGCPSGILFLIQKRNRKDEMMLAGKK